MIITIDGPVATGKSTVARKLSEALGFIFFDTGAMYRALTYGIMKNNIDINNTQQLSDYIKQFQYKIKVVHGQRRYFVGLEDVTDAIRSQNVTAFVSEVSAIPAVREKLVGFQRSLSQGVNAVFEGRDMGTTVFPNADLKIFLTGRPDVRAKRRYDELVAKNPELVRILTLEQCMDDINKRDEYDSKRTTSPLKQASDAFVVDTSDLSIEDVVFKILECKDMAKTKKKSPSAQPNSI